MARKFGLFLATAILSALILSGPARAGTPEPQWRFQKNVINHSLPLKRFRAIPKEASIKKESLARLKKIPEERVYWEGYVNEFFYQDGYCFMLLNIDNDLVWLVADDTVRNLDFNRKGYKIGVKGNVVLDRNNNLYYLDAWSLILLRAPREMEFPRYQETYGVPGEFTLTKNRKKYRVDSPYYPFICYWVSLYNPHYTDEQVTLIAKNLVFHCLSGGIDPRLMLSLFTIESAMDTDAVSHSGAIGLGQLMPGTASGLGVNPKNVAENIQGAVTYLGSLLAMWSGRPDQVALSLASYNAGPGSVSRHGGIPPYSETVNYVFFIQHLYREICRQTGELSSKAAHMEEVREERSNPR